MRYRRMGAASCLTCASQEGATSFYTVGTMRTVCSVVMSCVHQHACTHVQVCSRATLERDQRRPRRCLGCVCADGLSHGAHEALQACWLDQLGRVCCDDEGHADDGAWQRGRGLGGRRQAEAQEQQACAHARIKAGAKQPELLMEQHAWTGLGVAVLGLLGFVPASDRERCRSTSWMPPNTHISRGLLAGVLKPAHPSHNPWNTNHR